MSSSSMWAALPTTACYLKRRESGGEGEMDAGTHLKAKDWVVLLIELILYESK